MTTTDDPGVAGTEALAELLAVAFQGHGFSGGPSLSSSVSCSCGWRWRQTHAGLGDLGFKEAASRHHAEIALAAIVSSGLLVPTAEVEALVDEAEQAAALDGAQTAYVSTYDLRALFAGLAGRGTGGDDRG